MTSPKNLEFDEYFQLIRESAEPAVWSKSVALARLPRFEFCGGSNEKLSFRLTPESEVISPRVDLYIEEQDWQCSCNFDQDPCHHVVSTCILIRRLQNEGGDFPAATSSRSPIVYLFSNDSGSLYLRRGVFVAGDVKLFMCPLSSFVTNSEKSFGDVSITECDLQVEKILGPIKSGVFEGGKLSRIINALIENQSPEVYLDGSKVGLHDSKSLKPKFLLKLVDGMYNLVSLNENQLISFKNGFITDGKELIFYRNSAEFEEISSLLKIYSKFSRMDLPHFLSFALHKIQKFFEVDLSMIDLPEIVKEKPYLRTKFSAVTDQLNSAVEVITELVYGDPVVARVSGGRLELFSHDAIPERDVALERKLLSRLDNEIGGKIGIIESITLDAALDLEGRLGGLCKTEGLLHQTELSHEFFIGIHDSQFELGLEVSGQDGVKEKIDGSVLIDFFEKGHSFINLKELGVYRLPKDVIKQCYEQIKKVYELNARNIDPAYYLHEAEGLANMLSCEVDNKDGVVNFLDLLNQEENDFEAPARQVQITGQLRDYQTEASLWLQRLRKYGAGAMLADEMGLGKTLQAITALEGKSLVIVPTSLVKNWQVEIERFRPQLSVCIYHGPSRFFEKDSDVIISTYGIVRNEVDLFSEINWDVAILDEAQAIKNSSSLLSIAVKKIRARFRLALSGTPLENSLSDLWSQFDFILPGLLGEESKFSNSKVDTNALNSLIRPFYLRRLKRDVAKELPPKIETVLYCDMYEGQRAQYSTFLSMAKQKVQVEKNGKVGAFEALEAILRLRQICCHTGLMGMEPFESRKIEVLREKVSELVSNGEKILVFSQWTRFLDFIEEDLASHSITTFRLDGATTNRDRVVDKFKSCAGGGVFLISLKAGGTGLNLTEASHVFIMDPWWNPAVENQAIDRTHRIGQSETINIYRLVTSDSIEEKILLLQEDKKNLLDSIESGAAEEISKVTREQMIELFT